MFFESKDVLAMEPLGKKIYFLVIVLVFGGAIVAVSILNGRGPLAPHEEMRRPPFAPTTAAYYRQAVFRPSKMLFTDTLHYYIAPPRRSGHAGQLYPLVVVLHDENGAAPAAAYLQQTALALQYPAFVIVPQITSRESWAVAGGMRVRIGAATLNRADMAMALVREVVQKMPVDPTRIYVVGCGDGGTGVFRAAASFPNLVAAGVAMSGRWAAADAQKLAGTPLWVIHGQYDSRTPAYYMQNLSGHIRSLGGDIRFTVVPKMRQNCHDPRLYAPAVWSWLFSQQKAGQLPAQSAVSEQ